MYAIILQGGKQYKIKEGQKVLVDRIEGNAGESVKLDSIILISNDQGQEKKVLVGTPLIKDAFVETEIVDQVKNDKVYSYKFKKRKNFHKIKGHRQKMTSLIVRKISF